MRPKQITRRALLALLLPALIACGTPDTTFTGAAQPTPAVTATLPAAPPAADAPPATETPHPPPTASAMVMPPTPSLQPGSPQWYSHVELSPTLRLAGEALAEQGANGLALLGDGLVAALSTGATPEPTLRLIDLSDPAQPRVRGSFALANASALAVDGHTAWVATREGLQAVDLSDPDKPAARGSVALPGYKPSLRARGPYLYATVNADSKEQFGGLAVFDISDPAAPRLLAQMPTVTSGPTLVELVKDTAYVLNPTAGIQIVDLSKPDAPSPLSTYKADNGAVAVDGERLYLATAKGLEILDVSNPAKPRGLAVHPLAHAGGFSAVKVAGARAYLTTADFGSTDFGTLIVLDLSDPDRPVEVGRAAAQANAHTVEQAGPQIAVAFGRRGLLLFQDVSR